jgi:hypothetical protein
MLTIHREDDVSWPKKNIVGRQELEVRIDKEHISFEVSPHSERMNHEAITDYLDGKDWIVSRCERVAGCRGITSVLLPRSGFEGMSLSRFIPVFCKTDH